MRIGSAIASMKKTTLNAIVDTIAFFPFLIAAVTGVVLWLFLPCGGEFRRGGAQFGQYVFLGVVRHTWLDVHTYLGLLFVALVALHLVLHWGYIKCLPGRFIRRVRKKEAAECET
jgi:Domain of unknown function (DUF4405)